MSFSFRDKPRLSDRLRGKSGDEILNELKEHFDQDRKMFFDTTPSWGSTPMTGPFSRTGFPFDDDMMPRGRQDIRSHLDDLAQRHPEFADHLRYPPWAGDMVGARTWGRKRRGSGSGDDDARSQASGASSSSNEPTVPDGTDRPEQNDEPGPLRGRSRQGNLPQYGLRNTVDLGQQQHESEQEKQGRGQRSMSAPPDNRSQHPQQPQRFVSRIEINPVNPADPTSGGGPGTVTSESHGKPPMAPKPPQQQARQPGTPTKQPQTGNVRHIPIFVEGRDEPVLPKNVGPDNVEQVFTNRVPQPGVEQQQHSFGRPPPQFATPRQFYPQQQQTPPSAPRNFQQQQPASPKQQRQTKPQPPPQQQPPKPPEAPPANDPISRVQTIQKDVEDLQAKVNQYSGSSRDKEYMYLDEMLTRNLLKLDDIDTEGKENVRQARKEAIRSIQRCISVLEGKVPSPEEKKENPTEEVAMETGTEASQTAPEAEGKGVTENPPAEGAMEVAQTESDTKQVEEGEKVPETTTTATPEVTEQAAENVAPSDEQKMDVTQNAEVKSDGTDAVKEQVPMEVEEQKQNSKTPQTTAEVAESKEMVKEVVETDSAAAENIDISSKVPAEKPASEKTDSNTASPSQPVVEKSS